MSGYEKAAAALLCLTLGVAAAALAGITGWWPMAALALAASAAGGMFLISGFGGLRK